MVKKDLEASLAKRLGLSANDARLAVDSVLDDVGEALARGERIELRGFGVFFSRWAKQRVGRNPKTGEMFPVPAKHKIVFKLSTKLEALADTLRTQDTVAA